MPLETTYFGLTNLDLVFWSTIGIWLASIGTIAAVIISLVFSFNAQKIKLLIKSDIAYTISSMGENPINNKYIQIEVTNLTDKTITVENIYWQLSNKIKLIVPIPGNPYTTKFPAKISYGEKVTWMIIAEAIGIEWQPELIKLNQRKSDVDRWKVLVVLSTGQQFRKKFSNSIIELIKTYLKD